jgi:glycosyltransferase involved in cell wall biosynthesis
MTRIVFIATNEWVPWGGSEYCWAAAAERLALSGAEVSVSVKAWDNPVKQIDQLRVAGCRILYRPKRTLLRRTSRKVLLRREYDWADVRKIGTGADLVVISVGGTREGLTWLEAAKSLHFPYAVIMQAAGQELWPVDELGAQLASCYESAGAAYFVSEANLAVVRRQFATALERGRVIRNPFNVRYDARPVWPGDPRDQLSLACVARFEIVQKAQDVLIDVLSLPHWRSRNIRVALVGSGKNECSIREMVRTAQLTSVELVGFVDDIEQLWSRYHALVLPSRFEGMPLALVEAMLCGRPCIVTDVGGNRELVRDGVNGFLAKAPTVGLLDETMNRAWEIRHRLREMGERAALDVRQWVSPDPTADFVRELIALASGARSMGTFPIGQCQPSAP